MAEKKSFEKKIIAIKQEELLFLRESIIKVYGSKVDSPGDKSSYESLNNDITGKLNIGAICLSFAP